MLETKIIQDESTNSQEASEGGRMLARRLVELSERKMKLIKNLLSPEEYDSIAVNLFSAESTDLSDGEVFSSLGAASTKVPDDDNHMNYNPSISPVEQTERSLTASIAKRREINQFFFGSDDGKLNKQTDLSLELRSGHNINNQSKDAEAFLVYSGFNFFSGSTGSLKTEQDTEEFVKDSLITQQSTCQFSTNRNFDKMTKRLKSDNTLDKLLSFQSHEKIPGKQIISEYQSKHLMNFFELVKVEQSTLLESGKDSPFLKNIDGLKSRGRASEGLEINIISMMIREHPLLTDEERVAGKLADCGRELELLKNIYVKLAYRLIAKIQSLPGKYQSPEPNIKSNLLIVMNQLIQINDKMKSMQQELVTVYQELIRARKEQGFDSTTISIGRDEDSLKLFSNLGSTLEKIVASLDADEELKETLTECVSMVKETNQGYLIKFAPRNQKLASNEEKQRVTELTRWIQSLQVYLNARSSISCSCDLVANKDNLFILNLDPPQFQLEATAFAPSRLRLRMFTKRRWILPFMNRTQLLAEVGIVIKQNCEMRHSLNFESLDGSIIIQLVMESQQVVQIDEDVKKKLVNHLHRDLIPAHTNLMEYNMKLYQLMNYVDVEFLSKILRIDTSSSSIYFHIDPHEDLFEAPESVRWSLIRWRWINNLKQIIHLSNHENLKTHGQQVEEFKAKLKGISLQKFEGEHMSIEVSRAKAIAYMRKLEIRLLKMVASTTEQVKQIQDAEVPRADRFLRHPRLSLDLSGFVRLATSIKPRPTVRRPLAAQKAANRWANLRSSFLTSSRAQLTERLGRPQLVVNLQGASNVPLRMISRPQPMHSRSLSPIITTPSLVPTPVSLVSSGDFPMVSQGNFEQATSYVELVFQRYQVASSLASGTHPAWNETLFLPIQVPKETPETAESSLMDEYLQINLWDHHCHHEFTSSESNGLQQHDTLLLSPLRMPQKVSASSQRVERYLLGCLKIPLSALISTGKIEGTFALEQDSVLENYSFGLDPSDAMAPVAIEPNFRLNGSSPVRDQSHRNTFIRLFITLDPPFAIEASELDLGPSSSEYLLRYAKYWQETFSEHIIRLTGRGRSRELANLQSRGENAPINRLHVKALVLLSSGKYVIISRLLKPLDPPPTLLDGITETQCKMLALARYVSLLCPIKFGIFQHSARALASSLWFDSRQLLARCLGGPEEKAALLCNYFLGLEKYCGLLLGDSIQEGRCVYVIVWEDFSSMTSLESELQLQAAELFKSISGNSASTAIGDTSISLGSSVQIWNPSTATNYASVALSPLLSVGTIVTMDNVYANLQNSHGSPVADTNFNIRSRQHWFPLTDYEPTSSSVQSSTKLSFGLSKLLGSGKSVSWTKRCQTLELMRRMLGPVNVSPVLRSKKINYEPRISEQQCQQLSDAIELEVKSHLLKWRPQRPTYFNRSLSRSVQNWLKQFEELSSGGQQSALVWHLELANLIKGEPLSGFRVPMGSPCGARKLISCPLNIPYTGMKVILDTVYASGVANVDLVLRGGANSSQTQFLIGCHVKSYPAKVLSVWLYTAAILS